MCARMGTKPKNAPKGYQRATVGYFKQFISSESTACVACFDKTFLLLKEIVFKIFYSIIMVFSAGFLALTLFC